ncbi:MAG: DUF4373 domain-containing protein [Betaproteobacteria bacterium]
MARPLKEGMDYFPHDTDAVNDEKIEALRALYGNDGYAFYFILLERIYRTAKAELDVSRPAVLAALVSKVGVGREKFEAMLATALEIGCFDAEAYRAREVLTSAGIKRRAAEVQELRERWRRQKARGDGKPGGVSVVFRAENTAENQEENAEETGERKEKKSTVPGTRTDQGTSSQKKAGTRKSVLVGGGTRQGAAPNPDVKTFIDYYHDRFLSQFGEKPVIDGGKDGAIVKRLLSTYGLEKLKGLLDDFFAGDDPWIRKRGYTLGVFKSQINSLISKRRQFFGDEPDPDQQADIESTMSPELRRLINGG